MAVASGEAGLAGTGSTYEDIPKLGSAASQFPGRACRGSPGSTRPRQPHIPATRRLAGGMSTRSELISPLEPDLSRQLSEAMAFSGGRGPLGTLP